MGFTPEFKKVKTSVNIYGVIFVPSPEHIRRA
jgi:hypothetical protein